MATDEKFPGQQEDERILYVIRPHKVAIVNLFARVLFFALLVIAAVMLVPEIGIPLLFATQIRIILGVLLVAVLYLWYRLSSSTVTYITDRRLIRFDTRPPFSKRRRALFWTQVAKAKAFSDRFAMRMLRVGSIELRASVNAEENVIVDNVYYFDDLVNYIDKLLHLTHAAPAELKEIKPFVLKPKGKRD